MSKKLKAVESSIQPNHKEAELWITPTNNDGSKEVKYWNSKAQEWSECGSGSGESESSWAFYKFPDEMDIETRLSTLGIFSHVFSCTSETGAYSCMPSGGITQISTSKNTINSIGVDCKAPMRLKTGEVLTMDEYVTLVSNGSLNNVKEALESTGLTEITKEQFYAI